MGLDWFAFVVSFKGVFLEGLEVVFIVLTFGVSAGNVPLAAAGRCRRRGDRPRRRCPGPAAALAGAGEHDQVRRRDPAVDASGRSGRSRAWACSRQRGRASSGRPETLPSSPYCSAGSSSREASSSASAGVRRPSPRPEARRRTDALSRRLRPVLVRVHRRRRLADRRGGHAGAGGRRAARGRRARRSVAAAGPRGRVRGRLRAAADRWRPAVDHRRAWWLPPPPTGRTVRIRTASPSEGPGRRPETGPTTARA